MANDEQGIGAGSSSFPGTTIYPELHDSDYPSPLMTQGWSTGVPTDTTASRYQLGSLIRQKDASVPTSYRNMGTVATPVWAPHSGFFAAHAIWSYVTDGGTAGTITPAITAKIPANAILVGGTINSTTAVTGGSFSAGVSAGLTAPTTAILGVTNSLSTLTTDALVNAVPVFATPKKMTAAGNITVTFTSGNGTAGVVEIFVYYVVALNS